MKPISWKTGTFLILASAILLQGGCGYKDIEKRFFAVSIGVDSAKSQTKKYLISIKFAIPTVEKKPNDFIVVSEEADTIAEAVRIIKTKVDKEVDFSHAKAIIYSDEVAKTMEPHLIYWPSRRRDIQKITWVAIGTPSAKDVLKVKPTFEQVPSNGIFIIFGKEGTENPYVIPEYLFDFKKRFSEKGLDPYLPIIKANKKILETDSVGLFNKSKLKITLSPEETKLLNFFLKKDEKSSLDIKYKNRSFIIDTQKVKAGYQIDTSNRNHPLLKAKIKVKGRMEEAEFTLKNTDLPLYEQAAGNQMNEEFKELLQKLQKAEVDPIGFGLRYRARQLNQNDWQEWKRIYPNLSFQVNTEVKIEDTGLIE